MTRDEVKRVVMIMATTYPNWKPENMSNTVDVWTAIFKDYEPETIQKALLAYIQNDTKGFAPVPGQIIAHIDTGTDELSEQQAWDMVLRAIGNSIYHSAEEFEKLPRECQIAIGSAYSLKELAIMDADTVKSVEKSHFERNYRYAVEKMKKEYRKPENLARIAEKERQMIEN